MFTVVENMLWVIVVALTLSVVVRVLRGHYTLYDFVRQAIILTIVTQTIVMLVPRWARIVLFTHLAMLAWLRLT